jgi:CBS domain-containing protein
VTETTSSKKGVTEMAVRDAMHAPARVVAPEASLQSVASHMATQHIHAVVVAGLGEDAGDRPWGIVSALDLTGAVAAGPGRRTAADTAATEVLTVTPDEPLARAAGLMHRHALTHLVVVEPHEDRPIGILSTLDVARVLAES